MRSRSRGRRRTRSPSGRSVVSPLDPGRGGGRDARDVLVVGLHLIFGGPPAPDLSSTEIPDPDRDANAFLTATRSGVPRGPPPGPATPRASHGPPRRRRPPRRPAPEANVGRARRQGSGGRRASARSRPKSRSDAVICPSGPVRAGRPDRTRRPSWSVGSPTPTDGPTEPTLHLALDRHIGGTVEVADSGPFAVDDLRMSGESRVIRARGGYRPIIRIQRSRLGLGPGPIGLPPARSQEPDRRGGRPRRQRPRPLREAEGAFRLRRLQPDVPGLHDHGDQSDRCPIHADPAGTVAAAGAALADLAGADARPGQLHRARRTLAADPPIW